MPKRSDKPLDPRLPGKYGKMTEAEFDAYVARYDEPGFAEREFAAARRAGVPAARHPKPKPGLPPGERIFVPIESRLLKRVDAYVERTGETRAGMIRRLSREALAKPRSGSKPKRRSIRRPSRRASLQPQ